MNIEFIFVETALGKEIKSRLKAMGRTQIWLASQVELSPAQITQIVKGKRGTGINKLIDIGILLGIDRDRIIKLYRNEKENTKPSIRKDIELNLDRIERMNESRLHQVAEYIELIANSINEKLNSNKKNHK